MFKKVSFVLTVVMLLSNFSLMAQDSTSLVQVPSELAPMQQGIIGQGSSYTLGLNDVVQITVRNQDEFSGQFVVGPDGNIQYAFLGDIKADGLTKEGLKNLIAKNLSKYVKVPEVNVSIVAYRSKFIYMLGTIGRPGKYPMAGDSVNLRDAIFNAGVPGYNAALRRSYVIRPSLGKPEVTKVDLYTLLYKGNLKNDIILKPGDLVVIPSTVPSEINKALSTLLAPFSQAAGAASLANDFGN